MECSECVTCKHVPNLQIHQQHSQHQTLSISRATELIKQRKSSISHEDHDNDDEVSLHPLNNQVRNFLHSFFFLFCFVSFLTRKKYKN